MLLHEATPYFQYPQSFQTQFYTLESKFSANAGFDSARKRAPSVLSSGSSWRLVVPYTALVGYTETYSALPVPTLRYFWVLLVVLTGMSVDQFFAALHMVWIDQYHLNTTSLQVRRQGEPVVSCRFKPHHDAAFLLFCRQLRCPAQKVVKAFCAVLKFDCLTEFKATPIERSCPMGLTGNIHTNDHCCLCDLTDFLVLCYTHLGHSFQWLIQLGHSPLHIYHCTECPFSVQTPFFLILQESPIQICNWNLSFFSLLIQSIG